MVLIIALLHAAPIVAAALITQKKPIVIGVAVVMAIFAVATGDPRYNFIDLLAVLAGLGVALALQSQKATGTSQP